MYLQYLYLLIKHNFYINILILNILKVMSAAVPKAYDQYSETADISWVKMNNNKQVALIFKLEPHASEKIPQA